jgi:hypothetical protein
VSQEADAFLVGFGEGRVGFEGAVFLLGVDAFGEVFAVVEVLDYGADGFDVFVAEVDASLDWRLVFG